MIGICNEALIDLKQWVDTFYHLDTFWLQLQAAALICLADMCQLTFDLTENSSHFTRLSLLLPE